MIGSKIGVGKLAIVFVVDFPAAVMPRAIVHEQIAFATAAVPRVATVVSTEPFSSMKNILSSSFFVFAVGINGGSGDIVLLPLFLGAKSIQQYLLQSKTGRRTMLDERLDN